jgi:hypothetical protein
MPKVTGNSGKGQLGAITLTQMELTGLAQEVKEAFGSGSGIILHYFGFGIGQQMAEDAEDSASKGKEVFKGFQDLLKSRGWGTVIIEASAGSQGSGRISFSDLQLLENDAIHEAIEMLLKGMFLGFMVKTFNSDRVSFQKEKCVIRGDKACIFSFKAEMGE